MATPRISPHGFLVIGRAKVCRVVPGGLEFLTRGRHGEAGPVVMTFEELEVVIASVREAKSDLLQLNFKSAIVAPEGDL